MTVKMVLPWEIGMGSTQQKFKWRGEKISVITTQLAIAVSGPNQNLYFSERDGCKKYAKHICKGTKRNQAAIVTES